MVVLNPSDQSRLQEASTIWLATVRPNGTPHLVPIWSFWQQGKVYFFRVCFRLCYNFHRSKSKCKRKV